MWRPLNIDFGDIAGRMIPLLAGFWRVYALAHDARTAHPAAALAKGGSLPQEPGNAGPLPSSRPRPHG